MSFCRYFKKMLGQLPSCPRDFTQNTQKTKRKQSSPCRLLVAFTKGYGAEEAVAIAGGGAEEVEAVAIVGGDAEEEEAVTRRGGWCGVGGVHRCWRWCE
jgi:hypothetical protein